jgi:hypothetical protein
VKPVTFKLWVNGIKPYLSPTVVSHQTPPRATYDVVGGGGGDEGEVGDLDGGWVIDTGGATRAVVNMHGCIKTRQQ